MRWFNQLLALSVWRIFLLVGSGLLYAQGPESGYTARDLNPDKMESGRTSGVVIDPRNPRLAYTVSQGGFFASTDGGVTWTGNFNADGTAGMFGNGLNNGLTLFNAVAVDPDNSNNILVLVDDDNRTDPATRNDGIWRSSDGGRTFRPAAPHPCTDPTRGVVGHIQFSPDQPGLVVSSSVCGFGISFDSGATWRFRDPVKDVLGGSTPHVVSGVDLFPVGSTFFGPRSSSDLVGFCSATSDGRDFSVGIYELATGAARIAPMPAAIQWQGTSNCNFAFDPRNSNHFFVGGSNPPDSNRPHILEGVWYAAASYSALPVWHDLYAPFDGTNGRPTVVQVRPLAPDRLRVYFHNTIHFWYEDCGRLSLLFSCPTGLPPTSFLASPGPWQRLGEAHSDNTEIAFNPGSLGLIPCPLLMSGDGGNQRSTDCGASWSFASGIHTLLVDDAAFTGIGDGRNIVLANFDNGHAVHDSTGTWTFRHLVGDGWSADAIRTEPNEFVVSGDDDTAAVSAWVVDMPGFTTRFGVPKPPQQWLGIGYGDHFAPRYYDDHMLVIPTISASGDSLQLYSMSTSSPFPVWLALGPRVTPTSGRFRPSSGRSSDLAVGGRLNRTGANKSFYVIAPNIRGNELYCIGQDGTYDVASGVPTPIRVWASEADPNWAYVYGYDPDSAVAGVYVSSGRGRCNFVRDNLASDLLTRFGEFKGNEDYELDNPIYPFTAPMKTVGFDPMRPGRAAIGTLHNGILVTQDHGASWSVSHAFPEPNTGLITIYFDDSSYPRTIEETLVAANGRGVWAIRFGAGAGHYLGEVGPKGGGGFSAKLQLVDEAGTPVSSTPGLFTLRPVSPDLRMQPIQMQGITDQQGIVTLDQQIALAPGTYKLTAQFDRGPRFATVYAENVFFVNAGRSQQ